MSSVTNNQFNQFLNDIDWIKYPQLSQKVVSAFMVQTAGILNKLRESLSLAQAETLASQLKYGFNAATNMLTSGLIQAGMGGAQVAGGGWQTFGAVTTANQMKSLTMEFEENIGQIDSQLNSSNTFIEPVAPLNGAEEEVEGIVIHAEQIGAAPEAPVSQETVDTDALHAQKNDLRRAHDNNRDDIKNEYQKHFGIGQTLAGSGNLLHVVDGGAQAQKLSNDAANGSFEHNYQTQEASRNSVNQTADKISNIDMYAVNVATSRG